MDTESCSVDTYAYYFNGNWWACEFASFQVSIEITVPVAENQMSYKHHTDDMYYGKAIVRTPGEIQLRNDFFMPL